MISDPRLDAATAHALEGVSALAWGHKEQQRALGAAGAYGPVAALLRAPGVLGDAGLLEKSLLAVRVLCFCGAVSVETRDVENRLALGAAGACEGYFSVLLLIACMTGLIALLPFYSVNYYLLSYPPPLLSLLFYFEAVMVALKSPIASSNERVMDAALQSLYVLTGGDASANRQKFTDAGVCEGETRCLVP